MFEPTLHFGGITLSTYTTLISLALIIGAGFTLYRTRPAKRLQVLDVLLIGLILGILMARLEHVVLNWNYFAYNTHEITQIHKGGLDWHGAVIGAGIGIGLMRRWRRVALVELIDNLTLLLPLLSLAIWWGCWSASCRYGAEVVTLVDYPAWMVWEGRDIFGIYAPRFHTQFIGMMFSFVLLTMTLVLFWRNWLVLKRFWLLLSLVTGIMFFTSFLQGDYSLLINRLRVSQYVDGVLIIFALIVTLKSRRLT